MQRMAFHVCSYLFEIGIWKSTDLPKLAKYLLESTENITFLENRIKHDMEKAGLSETASTKMRNIILDAKYLITKIIIQFILLINDESLKQTVSWPRMRIQKSMEWKYAFFKDKEINTVISNILFKFVTRENRIVHADKNNFISSRLGRNIDTILMLLSDLRKDVFFTSSILLQDGVLIDYYSNKSSQSGFLNTGV